MFFRLLSFSHFFLRFNKFKRNPCFKYYRSFYGLLKRCFLKAEYFLIYDLFDYGKYDVLLIYPESEIDSDVCMPNSLLTIAGPLLQNGYRVAIIHQKLERNCHGHIDRILGKGVICVGMTFCTGGRQISYACGLMDYIKKGYPHIKIVVGGIHATILPEQTIEYGGVDVVVIGEGERTFLDLVRAIAVGGDLSGLKGICYKDGGRAIRTQPADPVDLNEHWRQLSQVYKRFRFLYPLSNLTTSRGCPGQCGYCAVSRLSGRWKALSPEIVVEMIEQRLASGLKNFSFIDDNFFADPKRAGRIADMIIKKRLKFRWWAECRADYIVKMEESFLRKLADAGLARLLIGAESGSDRILGLIDKDITVDTVRKANLRLKNIGIIPEFTFMMGFPTETPEEVRATKDLIKELISENPQAKFWKMNCYTPFPGTGLFDLAVKNGFVPPKELKGWADIGFYRKDYADVEHDYEV